MKSILTYYILILLSALKLNCYSQQENKKIEKGVVLWVEEYLVSNNRFLPIEKSIGKPIAKDSIRYWYHIKSIDKKKFDSVNVFIFQIGINVSHTHEDLLVLIKGKHSRDYKILDGSYDLKNTLNLFDFFKTYNKFSNKTKAICYEKIIRDYYYFNLQYE